MGRRAQLLLKLGCSARGDLFSEHKLRVAEKALMAALGQMLGLCAQLGLMFRAGRRLFVRPSPCRSIGPLKVLGPKLVFRLWLVFRGHGVATACP